ncbi:MAG TPA: hypothetical protein VGW74_07005 [Propionibacteriaceae bacterium]|nr:hypothetical protein [Propionibacteriaceae bacterium]
MRNGPEGTVRPLLGAAATAVALGFTAAGRACGWVRSWVEAAQAFGAWRHR